MRDADQAVDQAKRTDHLRGGWQQREDAKLGRFLVSH
jgi:hypothetical protein